MVLWLRMGYRTAHLVGSHYQESCETLDSGMFRGTDGVGSGLGDPEAGENGTDERKRPAEKCR